MFGAGDAVEARLAFEPIDAVLGVFALWVGGQRFGDIADLARSFSGGHVSDVVSVSRAAWCFYIYRGTASSQAARGAARGAARRCHRAAGGCEL